MVGGFGASSAGGFGASAAGGLEASLAGGLGASVVVGGFCCLSLDSTTAGAIVFGSLT